MIIDNKSKFIFIHNPKTAGMSLRRALSMIDGGLEDHTGDDMHTPMRELLSSSPEIIEKLRTYYVFMMVRNPYTRVVSGFNYNFPKIYYNYHEHKNLEDYKKTLNEFIEKLDSNNILDCHITQRHFIRQVDMAYHESVCYVDDFLKFEQMPQCFERLKLNNFDVYYRLRSYKHLNARPIDVTVKELLTEQSRTKIYEIYRPDFHTFGYSVEL